MGVTDTETQRCGSCKGEKPIVDFSPFYRGRTGTWCRPCFAANARGERMATEHEPRPCAQCNKLYVPAQLKAMAAYCTRKCKDDSRNHRMRAEREANKPHRTCVWCGADMPQRMRSDAKFCGATCNTAAHASTRKMWSRLGIPKGDIPLVSRSFLAERDGLDCHLCGLRLGLATKHPDPGYASIDHVEPLSLAGAAGNHPENLRLAHLVCNLRRRAQAVDEFKTKNLGALSRIKETDA